MKILIGYTSKSGGTAKCAELLGKRLEGSVLCDLSRKKTDIEGYDLVILGSGVRIGKVYKPLRQFMKNNEQMLKEKKTAFFFCNMEEDTFQKVVETNISQELRANAVVIESFGGKRPFSKDTSENWIKKDCIDLFVEKIKNI